MRSNDEAVKVLSELLQNRLSKDPELAAKQARLLAILAAREPVKTPEQPPAPDAEPRLPP